MATKRESAIRLRDWANYYADRWRVHASDLVNEAYGKEAIPMPSELRHRVAQLQEIGQVLDDLLPLSEQWIFWHLPALETKRSPASFLSMSADPYLDVVLNDLRILRETWEMSEGTYETGRTLTNALLKKEGFTSSIGNSWLDRWLSWPDATEVGIKLGESGKASGRTADRLRASGRLLGVQFPTERKFRYPFCQFEGSRIVPVMESLLTAMPIGSGSGWFQTFWLYSDHPMFEGMEPGSFLASRPALVLEAAKTFHQPSEYYGF